MTLLRLVSGSFCLAVCLAVAQAPLRAATNPGFSSSLSTGERRATGLDQFTADELAMFDVLVASDLATARQLRITTFGERFSDRHNGQKAGLERLDSDQLAQLDELIADTIAAQPLPKDRPRLQDNEVVSLQSRLQVHGGLSFTYGWASGGRDFREAGAWVSYYDPVSGLGLAVGFSQYSGDVLYPYGYYPYGYNRAGLVRRRSRRHDRRGTFLEPAQLCAGDWFLADRFLPPDRFRRQWRRVARPAESPVLSGSRFIPDTARC